MSAWIWLGELGRVAEVLEVRELLRAFGHGLRRLCRTLLLRRFLARLRASALEQLLRESSQPRQASVMLWP